MMRMTVGESGGHSAPMKVFNDFCEDGSSSRTEETVANKAMDSKTNNPIDWLFERKLGASH